ncbi:MAG: twin-arginine translocase subunit TatC [Verrucomicrobia bacterium]|nr:twin-arginine translocase subunit TatC [Verrucomicrobiota bacterium]
MKDPADESLVPRHPGPEPDPYEDEEGGPVKPFLEHLEDLRWLLVRCLITFVVAFALCLCFAPQLMSILQAPLDKAAQGKITLAILEVTGSFTIALQIGIWGGLCIAFPFLLYFVGDYIVPALRKVEKKNTLVLPLHPAPSSSLLVA